MFSTNRVRILACLTAVVMLFASFATLAASASPVPASKPNFNAYLSLDVSHVRTDNSLRYVDTLALKDTGDFAGPQDFAVSDSGDIFLLDTQNKRIFCSTPLDSSTIDLSYTEFPTRLWWFDNILYVLDRSKDVLVRLDLMTDTIDTIVLPDTLEAMFIEELYMNDDGKIVVVEESFGKTNNFVINGSSLVRSAVTHNIQISDNSVSVQLGSNSWQIDISNSFIQVAGVDASNNLYLVVNEYVPNSSVTLFESTVRRYDSNGVLTGISLLNRDNWVATPMRYAKVNANGDAFALHCNEDSVVVSNVAFGLRYVSRMKQLEAVAAIISKEQSVLPTKSVTTLSREQVRTRAVTMANTAWLLQRANRVYPENAAPPPYILLAQVPTTGLSMTGIPYCWGGMNGCDNAGTAEYMKSFASRITARYGDNLYAAGNVRNAGLGYISGTAGLDCSGFVGSAYGMTVKRATSWFLSNAGTVINRSELQPMDMLVKDGHIMLFVSVSTSGTYTIYDCTSTDSTNARVDKVSLRTEPLSYVSGFTAKTPWN